MVRAGGDRSIGQGYGSRAHCMTKPRIHARRCGHAPIPPRWGSPHLRQAPAAHHRLLTATVPTVSRLYWLMFVYLVNLGNGVRCWLVRKSGA